MTAILQRLGAQRTLRKISSNLRLLKLERRRARILRACFFRTVPPHRPFFHPFRHLPLLPTQRVVGGKLENFSANRLVMITDGRCFSL